MTVDDTREWLEADGLGGFASGTVSGVRTRRYHALLLTASTPPTGRIVLVNGVDAWVDAGSGREALTTQHYTPDVLSPDGASAITHFTTSPWPTWELRTASGCRIVHEVCVERHTGRVAMSWTVADAPNPVTLFVRPFISGRDYHALHLMNPDFRFEPLRSGARVSFSPYDGVPSAVFDSNGEYRHQPFWYRNFLYRVERERGLDCQEDLGAPGEWTWHLQPGARAVFILSAANDTTPPASADEAVREFEQITANERLRRTATNDRLLRSASAFIVQRGSGETIVAGYPWFTDWGRDTFIAMRGLCLATGRLSQARDILLQWSTFISDGMLPNRFPDAGTQPEFNSVDASLWFIIVAGELLERAAARPEVLTSAQRQQLQAAIETIIGGYAGGTRFGIHADEDGLLACGLAGSQITWMDARVGDRAVTPRVGKPVEVQALWLNALQFAAVNNQAWQPLLEHGRRTLIERFWNDDTGMLADVVDVNHVRGTRDNRCRPNQVLAVGGLPFPLVDPIMAARIVSGIEHYLLTPMGLRTLAPFETGYIGRYEGTPTARDSAYHQGTVWPWLMGPFVEAWVRVQGDSPAARQEARRLFLTPLLAHLDAAGLDHISEIADGDAPHTPRGCPFQAWSLGEAIRLDREVLWVDDDAARA